MKALVQFVQPTVFKPPIAPPPTAAWPPVAARTGWLPATAGDDLAPALRGANRESRELFGSASDPP